MMGAKASAKPGVLPPLPWKPEGIPGLVVTEVDGDAWERAQREQRAAAEALLWADTVPQPAADAEDYWRDTPFMPLDD